MRVIPADNASAWTGPGGNNTYLLEGPVPTLIDAGVGTPSHLDAIASALAGRELGQVLVTHGHPDHASGIPAIVSRWPRVRVRARTILQPGGHALADGEEVAAGAGTLAVVATPGHAPDHLCFFDPATGDLYAGDLVREHGSIVVGASHGGDIGEYLASLRRIRDLRPRRILPGHGPVIQDPATVVDRFIRHRLDREAQVLAALNRTPQTPAQLAAVIYADLSPALERAAADTVLAHLAYLARTGRAAQAGEGWIRTAAA